MHVRFLSTLTYLYVLDERARLARLLDTHFDFDFRDDIRGDEVVVAVAVRYLQDDYGTYDSQLSALDVTQTT
jgi:hypothetical protein